MLLINIWFYVYVKNNTENDMHDTFTLLVHNASIQSTTQQINDIKNNIITMSSFANEEDMASFIDHDNGNLKKLIAYTLNSSRFISNILFMNKDEKFKSTPEIPPSDLVPRTRPWFKNDKNKNNLITFTNPYLDVLTKLPIISASKNLYDSNGINYGLVSMDLDLYEMSKPLNQIKVSLGGELYIVHKDGHIIMSANKQQINSEIPNLKWLENINSVQNYFYDPQTESYVYYYVFSDPDWIMLLVVKNEKLQEIIAENRHPFILIGIISFILYIAVSMLWNVNFQYMMSELLSSLKNGGNNKDIHHSKEMINIYDEIYKQHHEKKVATKAAQEDELTGLYNRRAFNYCLKSLIESRSSFTIGMIDIDNFKCINDEYGHAIGDSVLQEICNKGKTFVGKSNLLFRYGGEEIIVIFMNLTEEESLESINAWRKSVESTVWPELNELQVTFSGGLLTWSGQTEKELLNQVDLLLYKAKSTGKNNIMSLD
ncbi:TPA: diguanylate cyclase [Providencia rettgeri]|nr:diguanylate cyclase [Providencia rettgeri]